MKISNHTIIRRLSSAILPQRLKVKRSEPTMVVPAVTTPREVKALSELDNNKGLLYLQPILLAYKHNSAMAGKDPAKVIKEALAKVMVPYYPFAGRLVEGPRDDDTNLFLVDCKGEGVPFIEADADNKLDQVIDRIESGESAFFQELLHYVPLASDILGCPLWLFQVTRFKCGGFTLGLRFNHVMADGSGLGQVLKAMGEYARGAETLSLAPVWQRDSFLAKKLPSTIHQRPVEYEEIENVSLEATAEWKKYSVINKSFYFSPEEIKALKSRLQNKYAKRYSTYEVLTACFWRSRTRALKLNPNQIVQLVCPHKSWNQKDSEIAHGYYGNAVAVVTVTSTSEALCTHPLDYALELVKKAKEKMIGDSLRKMADNLKANGRAFPMVPWAVVVSDNRKVGIDEADFGWGKPVFGAVTGDFPQACVCVRFKDGILMEIALPLTVMDRFQNEVKMLIHESLHNATDRT